MKSAIILSLFVCASAQSLTIERIFLGGDPPPNVSGAGDLEMAFNAAADMWEMIYFDDHVLRLQYQWGPLDGWTAIHELLDEKDGRETFGRITFANNGGGPRWGDGTPYDSDEYSTYEEREFRSINAARLYTDPRQPNGVDLFSVSAHEIGHGLGLHPWLTSFWPEARDGYIHIAAPLPFAGTPVLLGANGSLAHIGESEIPQGPLMQGLHTYERRLPTALDILVLAQISKWRKINLDLRPVLRMISLPQLDSLAANTFTLGGYDFPGSRFELQTGGFISITNEAYPLTTTNSGTARRSFAVPATAGYLVRALVRALDGSSNSLWIDIDADPTAPYATWHMAPTEGFQWRTASWQGSGVTNSEFAPKIWQLAAGRHELRLIGREGNCELMSFVIMPADGQPTASGCALEWSAHSPGSLLSAPSAVGPWEDLHIAASLVNGKYVASVATDLGMRLYRVEGSLRPRRPARHALTPQPRTAVELNCDSKP